MPKAFTPAGVVTLIVEVMAEYGISDPIGGDSRIYNECAERIRKEIVNRWLERIMNL